MIDAWKRRWKLRGEKLNYKSVAKEISKPSFFGSWSPVGIKVYYAFEEMYNISKIIDL